METISLSLFDWSDVFFFPLLDGVGVRKQQPRSKHRNFHEFRPTGGITANTKRLYYGNDVIVLVCDKEKSVGAFLCETLLWCVRGLLTGVSVSLQLS